MSSRVRSHLGIVVVVMLAVVAGLFSTMSMLGFAQEPLKPAAPTASRFANWYNGWIKLRAADEADLTDKTKKLGLEVLYDTYAGTAVYSLAESGSIAAAEIRSNFELRTARTSKSYEVFRIQRYTGEVNRWVGGAAWTKIVDPQPLGFGQYDLSLMIGGDDSLNVLRIENISGATWHLGKDGFVKLEEPK